MIIGLTGAAGNGKDNVADILVEEHRFQRIAFADCLYEEVSTAFKERRGNSHPLQGIGMRAPICLGTLVYIGGSPLPIRFQRCLHNRLASIAVLDRRAA